MPLQSLELQNYGDIFDQALDISLRLQDEVVRVSGLRSQEYI